MPPKRVQDLHVVGSVDGNRSTSDVASDSSSCSSSKRRNTRATHSDMLRNLIERHGKIPLTFRKVDGRPSGQYAAAFMTELGIAVKKFAPVQVSKWKKITDQQKMPIFDRLENSFVVDFGKGPNSVRKETDKLMNARYRDNRCKMHNHYLALDHLHWERRLKNVPFEYCDTVKDWDLCAHCLSQRLLRIIQELIRKIVLSCSITIVVAQSHSFGIVMTEVNGKIVLLCIEIHTLA